MNYSLIDALLSAFKENDINYVHWKSNTNIDKALIGVDDLDILVAPADAQKINKIFSELAIIRAYSAKDAWQKDIYHYYGIDTNSAQLVHVHLHYALVVGYDYDKNFNLPIVAQYLNNRQGYKNIHLPVVEKEYILLIIRLLLKNALTPFLLSLPPVQLRKLKNAAKGVVTGGGYREFEDLYNRADHQKVKEIIETEFTFLSYTSFQYYESVVKKNNSIAGYFKAAKKLKSEISKTRVKNELSSFFVSLARLTNDRFINLSKKIKRAKATGNKLPGNGGRVIAFVGGDGAGKSTNVNLLYKVLSRHLKTHIIHIGRPGKSVTGTLIKVVNKFVSLAGFKKYSLALYYLALAYDRLKAFNKAQNIRQNGGLVLLDRIPLKGITAMDCPRIHTIDNNRFAGLSKLEQKIYNKIKGVDQLFILKLDPQIAIARRPEDDKEELLIRSGQIWNNHWEAPYAIEINTGENTMEQVQTLVLTRAWQQISTPFIRTEVLGLNGTGKSTLIKAVYNRIPNTLINIPVKNYPLLVAGNMLVNGFKAIAIALKLKNKVFGEAYLHFNISVDIIKSWTNSGKAPATNFIMDQGIIFQMVMLLKEGVISTGYCLKQLKHISKFISHIYLLEAPREVLWERINNRPNQIARGADSKDWDAFNKFCDDYTKAFSVLYQSEIKIVSLNTVGNTPEELASFIQNAER
ncbi:hypothetical protein EWM62_11855 [Mucilaginibacter terrigena]|uniref:Thymidylate kinase n=1 Tax=Mucilaginibacter terrigena TaxID=2492395 RepID=A0A4Q5LKK0_9SPHI|nr:hypothetical protein [Mucilaginibacter terrigena]RYU90224.1 hypothetical protein EWM62_11855 [Mucilaginibacter terrigena]